MAQILSIRNRRAFTKRLMGVGEAREISKDRTSCKSIVSAYPSGKQAAYRTVNRETRLALDRIVFGASPCPLSRSGAAPISSSLKLKKNSISPGGRKGPPPVANALPKQAPPAGSAASLGCSAAPPALAQNELVLSSLTSTDHAVGYISVALAIPIAIKSPRRSIYSNKENTLTSTSQRNI
ncbi:hypothetical protein EVAR_89019_1 [Eumeta japonica]|uniref:Uncharacterized protein n=1 Tax=Eumeta variegata TaxID=151549 RepID=A0A4C1X829_EUMVA|nr:hypothetical protein EVAR_89019_1 [Eumeta japonica]